MNFNSKNYHEICPASSDQLTELSLMKGAAKDQNNINFQNAVARSVEILASGGVILYPTDTVWGIGCDATNDKAVQRIFKLKRRSDSKSMICLVHNKQLLKTVVGEIPESASSLMKNTSHPLTIIYPQVRGIAHNLLANDASLAVRLVKNDFCEAVIEALGNPLVSTSANISGKPTPEGYKDIDKAILKGVDYIVPLNREKQGGRPSKIIKLEKDYSVTVIRE